jgi:hypothetical protein
VPSVFRQLSKLIIALQIFASDCVSLCAALSRNRAALAAENLYLRKQLALFQEREKRARPTPLRTASSSLSSLTSSTGAPSWQLLSLPRSSAGIELPFADSGVGNRNRSEGREYRPK